jgi:hypothetical protein
MSHALTPIRICNDGLAALPQDTVPMWAFLPGYIAIILTIVFVELTTFRHSHSSSTIAAWAIMYFSLDAAMCMLATIGVTNNLKVRMCCVCGDLPSLLNAL